MKHTRQDARSLGWAVPGAIALALAGCGGGGGGGGTPPPPPLTLTIDAGNSDTVAHASAGSVLAMSPVQTLPLSALGASNRSSAQGWAGPQRSGWLGRVLAAAWPAGHAKTLAAGAARTRPLAVEGPFEEPCAVSGSVSVTYDDHDDDGTPSPGDVLTMAFNACKDSVDETVDGVVAATYLEIGSTSLRSRMTMTELWDRTSRHGTKTTGSAELYYEMVSASQDLTRMTADGPITASVSTHLPYTDTLTLRSGFVAELAYDGSTGMSNLRVSGIADSRTAGGSMEVTTQAGSPIAQGDSERYPSAGVVQVRGKTGTVTLTVLSTDSVRVELDADDNGTPESSSAVAWDWLF